MDFKKGTKKSYSASSIISVMCVLCVCLLIHHSFSLLKNMV